MDNNSLVISYLALRKALGVLGMALPLILWLGAFIFFRDGVQDSISHYYYTGMRDVFVGIIFAIGLFLASYTGYRDKPEEPERKPPISDNMAGNIASVCAILLAILPTTPETNPSLADSVKGVLHFIFAAGFFLLMAYFCLWLFTRTAKEGTPTPRKQIRNQIYRVCGITILVAIALIAGAKLFLSDGASKSSNIVFWLEAVAVVAFGFSWLVKGEALLWDQQLD